MKTYFANKDGEMSLTVSNQIVGYKNEFEIVQITISNSFRYIEFVMLKWLILILMYTFLQVKLISYFPLDIFIMFRDIVF